jgi:hypothetical protein
MYADGGTQQRSEMASKVVLVALVLVALVAVAMASSESGHAALHRAEQSLSWMNGMKGGPPSGMQPSVTTVTIPERPTMIGN